MFSGRVVPRREKRWRTVRHCGDRTEVLVDAHEGSMPTAIVWSELQHGPIPPGWRVVSYDPSSREIEIAPEWYAPALRLVVLARRAALWGRIGVEMLGAWWDMRPRRIRR